MNHAAIDLGAGSGRVFVGDLRHIELVHRFPTRNINIQGRLYWDILGIFHEILAGLKMAMRQYELASIAIDSWAVDYVLVDSAGSLLGNPHHYRDRRTAGLMEEYIAQWGREDIYSCTGIQFLPFNTIYQLMAEQRDHPERLAAASALLTIPDLLNYWLTGRMCNEFSNATTTQLFNYASMDWAWEIIDQIKLPHRIFGNIVYPGEVIGQLSPALVAELGGGQQVKVIAVASHDTGSAVAGVPANGDGNFAYLSSGTWSLIGLELDQPLIGRKSMEANFTNEGGVGKSSRFLKNIMGIWILQECRRFWGSEGNMLDYSTIISLAEEATATVQSHGWQIDVNDPRFFGPNAPGDGMPDRIRAYCVEHGQGRAPQSPGEIAMLLFSSLAACYADSLATLRRITDRRIDRLHIIGGGSQNSLLCRLTAQKAAIPVYAGPVEATAMGNILVQELATGQIPSLEFGRAQIRKHTAIHEYLPH